MAPTAVLSELLSSEPRRKISFWLKICMFSAVRSLFAPTRASVSASTENLPEPPEPLRRATATESMDMLASYLFLALSEILYASKELVTSLELVAGAR